MIIAENRERGHLSKTRTDNTFADTKETPHRDADRETERQLIGPGFH